MNDLRRRLRRFRHVPAPDQFPNAGVTRAEALGAIVFGVMAVPMINTAHMYDEAVARAQERGQRLLEKDGLEIAARAATGVDFENVLRQYDAAAVLSGRYADADARRALCVDVANDLVVEKKLSGDPIAMYLEALRQLEEKGKEANPDAYRSGIPAADKAAAVGIATGAFRLNTRDMQASPARLALVATSRFLENCDDDITDLPLNMPDSASALLTHAGHLERRMNGGLSSPVVGLGTPNTKVHGLSRDGLVGSELAVATLQESLAVLDLVHQ